mmetsp:Transcript_18550/g.16146  ORF Transcript_18550/g.16146 Transcript_18550/m.16146 type:complete len:109 (-) Transcript_18550:988-1314(-)
MDDKNPLNNIPRNLPSRDGIRVPSRDKNSGPINPRPKNTTMLRTSNQNFYNSQLRESMSDMSSSADDLMLQSVNIAIDETSFISNTKADILQLQEDINRMDIDGKIRN